MVHLGCSVCDSLAIARTSEGIDILLANKLTVSAVKTIQLLLQHASPAHVRCTLCQLEEAAMLNRWRRG